MAGLAGGGAIRTLVIALRIDDAGASRALGRFGAQVGMTNVLAGQTSRNLGLLQAQMAILGFTGLALFTNATLKAAAFGKEIQLAKLASDDATDSIQGLGKEAMQLGERFRVGATEAARVIRVIKELGAKNEQALATASLALNVGTGGATDAERSAKTLARLAIITREGEENALGWASAISVVGADTAAGIPELEKFLQTFELVGVTAQFNSEQLIAMAGALAHIQPNRTQTITTSVHRQLSQVIPGRSGFIAAMLGMSIQDFEELRQQDPASLLANFAAALKQLPKGQRGDLLHQLGFTERDIQTLSILMADLELYESKLLPAVQRQMRLFRSGRIDQLDVMQRAESMNKTLDGSVRGLAKAWEDFSVVLGQTVAPVLQPLIEGLTALLRLLQHNRALLTLLLGLGGFAAFKFFRFGLGQLLASRGGMLGGFAGGLGDGLLGRKAAMMGTFRELATMKGGGRLLAHGGSFLAGLFGKQFGLDLAGLLARGGALAGLARIGVGGLGLLTNPITAVLGLLMSLAAPFRAIGDALAHMGEQGGIVGIVFKSLALVFKGLALVGGGLNAVFGALWDVLKGFFDWFANLPIVKDLVTGANQFLSDLNRGADDLLNKGAVGIPNTVSPPGTHYNYSPTINLGTDSGDAARRALDQHGMATAFGFSRAPTRTAVSR